MIIDVLLQKLTLSLIQFDRSSTKMPRTKLKRIGWFGGASVNCNIAFFLAEPNPPLPPAKKTPKQTTPLKMLGLVHDIRTYLNKQLFFWH